MPPRCLFQQMKPPAQKASNLRTNCFSRRPAGFSSLFTPASCSAYVLKSGKNVNEWLAACTNLLPSWIAITFMLPVNGCFSRNYAASLWLCSAIMTAASLLDQMRPRRLASTWAPPGISIKTSSGTWTLKSAHPTTRSMAT